MNWLLILAATVCGATLHGAEAVSSVAAAIAASAARLGMCFLSIA